MTISDRKGLKAQARQALSQSRCNIRQLTLLYCAVALGAPFVLELLSILIAAMAPATGGLSGMGTQNIFSTVSSLLTSLPAIFLPFWNVGFLAVSMGILHRQMVSPRDLTAGLRGFWPFLRLFLLESLIYMGLAMLVVYASTMIATPFSGELSVLVEEMLPEHPGADLQTLLAQAPTHRLLAALTPIMVVMTVAAVAILVPMYYRLSQTGYVLLEAPELGAVAAVSLSRRFTKGSCWRLFLLDLSFWWYHLLTFLAALASLTPALLELFGISTGMSPTMLGIVCSLLSIALSTALNLKFMPYVSTTYAAAFEALREAHLKPSLPEQAEEE